MVRLIPALAPSLLSISMLWGSISPALPATTATITPLLHAVQLPSGGSLEGVPGAAPNAASEGLSDGTSGGHV